MFSATHRHLFFRHCSPTSLFSSSTNAITTLPQRSAALRHLSNITTSAPPHGSLATTAVLLQRSLVEDHSQLRIHRASFTTATLMLARRKRQEEENRRKAGGKGGEQQSKFGWLKYCFVVFPITTFALGTWQVYRKDWKEKILADAAQKLAQDPIALPPQLTEEEDREDWQYRKVEVKGVFDHNKEILVGPRLFESEDGYHVVTPLVRSDGLAVLINRGWIPKALKSQASRERSQPNGEQTIVGFMKNIPPKTRWVPENEPENNNWFWLDVPTIQEKRVKDYPLFPLVLYSTTSGPSGLPRAHPASVDIRNQHLSYIFTWYSLTIAFTVMTRVLLKK
eukprot:TRINITY_DN4816_c0_g1_i2.p2 TRINITY_DN4816_c0_g1~~TRINITY_DN4816_c0_g1_i2.p2  ORF type:complete len:366 (+),score=93.00 TRINITY_DN4816_c0_g1_i2:88-1098(+)